MDLLKKAYFGINLLILPQLSMAEFRLENSKSVYLRGNSAQEIEGYVQYEFINEDPESHSIDLLVTVVDLDGSSNQSSRRVSSLDYVLAHEEAAEMMTTCSAKINYNISGRSVLGCRVEGPNGYTVFSPDIPMTNVETLLRSEDHRQLLVEFDDGSLDLY